MLEIEIIEVSVTQMGFALMLKPPTHEKVVPIFIGPLETYSISSALEGQKFERPLTHDLMKTVLNSTGYKVEKAFIDDFKSGTFYAKLYLEDSENENNAIIEIDSRPSDAIAIAVRFKAPIYMAEHVYEQTAIDMSLLKEKPKNPEEEFLTSLTESLPEEILSDQQKDDLIQTIIDEFGQATPAKGEKKGGEKSEPGKEKKEKKEKKDKSGDKLQSREDVLKQMLKVAIAKERYEDAAALRDELLSLRATREGQISDLEDEQKN